MLAATAVAPGFWDWSLDPPLVLVLVTAALYALGDRRTVTPARAKAARRVQRGCFYGGLAVLLIALASPIDALSEQLFWVHMVQHVLLLVVAAPLIVLAQPWIRLWRGLPLDLRRRLARGLAQGERTRWLRSTSRTLGSPAAASSRSASCCSRGTCLRCSTRRYARRRCTRSSTRCSWRPP